MTSPTNKTNLSLCGCLALVLTATACTQTSVDTRASDEAAVRDADVQWSKAAATHDVDATVSYYSDDASVFPPNAPLATGRPAIRALWSELLSPGSSLSWEAKKVEVARSGDLAYLTGTYQLSMKDPQGNTVEDHGKMVEVWKKLPDGKWKAVADIFNSDLPLPAPPEKKK